MDAVIKNPIRIASLIVARAAGLVIRSYFSKYRISFESAASQKAKAADAAQIARDFSRHEHR